MKQIFLVSLLSLISLASFGQFEIAKSDTAAATQSTRLRIGANSAGQLGFKTSTGTFQRLALWSEVVAAASGVQKVNNIAPVSGNVTVTTNDITENGKLFYTDARARAALSASGAISYNSTTGAFGFSGDKTTIGLGNLVNSLQVINAGGIVSEASGTLSARPAVGTAGRKYYATDNFTEYFDNGTSWQVIQPAISGDGSIAAGGTTFTLSTVNSNVGTFGSGTQGAVQIPIYTVNAKGLVTTSTSVNLTPALIGAPDLSMILPVTTVSAYSNIASVTAPAAGTIKIVEVTTDGTYGESSTLYILKSNGKYHKIITGPAEN